MMGRRAFVKRGSMAMLAMGLPPEFLIRPLLPRLEGGMVTRRKTLVCIFQRGAVDGISMIVPWGDPAYGGLRRLTAIPAPGRGDRGSALDLDGFFGFHPSMAPLLDLFRDGSLAAIHAVGSPSTTRSHFDAQDFMESGTPGVKSTPDGWLNRLLQQTGEPCHDCPGRTLADPRAHALDHARGEQRPVPALRGVAAGPVLPRSLRGEHPALSVPDLSRFSGVENRGALRQMYAPTGGDAVTAAGEEAFAAMEVLGKLDPGGYRPAPGAVYPGTPFGRSMAQVAQLIKAEVGVEVAFADLGGWDTHVAQGGVQGILARRLEDMARGIRAFHDDLGARMEDVVVLTMSEFGRTARENGSGGTDHGHGSGMLVMGGGVHGGRVLGEWPGLGPDQLHQGRDLAVTTDFRDLFGEVALGHLGARDPEGLFPGHLLAPPGILRQG